MLAPHILLSVFLLKNACTPLETWYTSAEAGDSRNRHLHRLTLNHKGRDPTMTRIPLNQAYESNIDLREKLQMSCAEIGLAVRTTNCLEERGVFTVDDLLNCKREDLLSISNFGEKTLEEVYKALEGIGFFRPNHRPMQVV
jgi:DNA-directed RNA polymerase subunit alpha